MSSNTDNNSNSSSSPTRGTLPEEKAAAYRLSARMKSMQEDFEMDHEALDMRSHDSRGHFNDNSVHQLPPDLLALMGDKAVDPAADASSKAASAVTKDARIRLGICAMDKKARSKPMHEILSRLDKQLFQVIFFGDDRILNDPVESWPICDVMIAFFSKGYPLDKAKAYADLRKPFIVNDLDQQFILQDRRRVYDLLQESGIDVPCHVYLSRDGYVSRGKGDGNGAGDQEVQEFDDHIEVNGVTIDKPFVEKPVDAEDHNISIYYPTSAGGGCKKLFRKIGNRSSEFYPNINEVRRDGSYIYEAFVETQGTDVKMYTVGPEYGHAEARKSPAVDGKVERNPDGKEVRFPVILSYREKEIARRIVLNFKQFVCGFDILRVQEGHSVVSYVCDVNGWSFVKNSRKYYDDCAQVLSEHFLALVKPGALKRFSTLDPLVTTSLNRETASDLAKAARELGQSNQPIESICEKMVNTSANSIESRSMLPIDTGELLISAAATLVEGAVPVRDFPPNLTSEPASISQSGNSSVAGETPKHKGPKAAQGTHEEELRCVLAIVRHGDRTPKQKLKVNMNAPHVLRYFHKHTKDCKKEHKVKAKAPLTEFLAIVKDTLAEMPKGTGSQSLRYKLMHMRDILERWKIVGLNRKIQIKPLKFEDYVDESGEAKVRCTEVQLVMKWGGNLTKLGEKQSIQLGRRLRQDLYPDNPGGGILRLHSTFRHDLKIKTSDEGRVMKTAAAFAKGLLELEGDLPPILVSLVHKEKGSAHMLDPSGHKEVKEALDTIKEKITANLQRDIDVNEASEEEVEHLVGPKLLTAVRNAIRKVGNPRKTLMKIHKTMGELIEQLDDMLGSLGSGDEKHIEGGEGLKADKEADFALSGVKLYKGETLLELTERWRFIYDRLYDSETDCFDLSRIPDVHDNVRFDVLHNPHLGLSQTLYVLYELAKDVADTVVPQEYGRTIAEKRSVGAKICSGLLEKVKYDLNVARTDNEVDMRYMINMDYSADLPINTMGRRIRTRLYFTSESHLHTVLNTLRFGRTAGNNMLSKKGIEIINETPELCYLTQIVMRVFEDSRAEMANDPRRFRVEILFSPGATATPLHMGELERDADASRFDTAPLQMIGRDGLTCEEIEDFFEMAIMEGQTEEETEQSQDRCTVGSEIFSLFCRGARPSTSDASDAKAALVRSPSISKVGDLKIVKVVSKPTAKLARVASAGELYSSGGDNALDKPGASQKARLPIRFSWLYNRGGVRHGFIQVDRADTHLNNTKHDLATRLLDNYGWTTRWDYTVGFYTVGFYTVGFYTVGLHGGTTHGGTTHGGTTHGGTTHGGIATRWNSNTVGQHFDERERPRWSMVLDTCTRTAKFASQPRQKDKTSTGTTKIATTTMLLLSGSCFAHPSADNNSTAKYSYNNIVEVAFPNHAFVGDMLFLFLSRTDDLLPLELGDGWSRAAACYKTRNQQVECLTAQDCTVWSGDYCIDFGSSTVDNGRDLATAVFYKPITGKEPAKLTVTLEGINPTWAILTAVHDVDAVHPVRAVAGRSCDQSVFSQFPSVQGARANDLLLLSQSFDDNVTMAHFSAPNGTLLLANVTGEDEAGFLFGTRLLEDGPTKEFVTNGVGAPMCKDILLSVVLQGPQPNSERSGSFQQHSAPNSERSGSLQQHSAFGFALSLVATTSFWVQSTVA